MESIKNILKSTCIAGLLLGLNACISEDRSNCIDEMEPGEAILYMSYNPICYSTTDDQSEEIERVDLFIFDTQGKFVERLTDLPTAVDYNYSMHISLDPGSYRFIVWGNLMDCYYLTPGELIPGETSMDDIMVHLTVEENDSIYDEPHILYFSDLDNVQISSSGQQSLRMKLDHNIHRINVTVENYPYVDHDLSLIVADTHGSFEFDNTPAYSPTRFHYVNSCIRENPTYTYASVTTMKLNYDRETWLMLYSHYTNDVIYEIELVELIQRLKGQGVDVDIENDCSIELTLRFNANMEVDVYINGWKVIEDNIEI